MSKVWFTTSFNKEIGEGYGKYTVLPNIAQYKEDDEPAGRLIWLDNDDDLEWFKNSGCAYQGDVGILESLNIFKTFNSNWGNGVPFQQRNIDPNTIPDGVKFRFNYMPFARKVFAWIGTYMKAEVGDLIVWFDADLKPKKKMTVEDVQELVGDADLAFLDRDFPWYAAETGWFAIRKNEKNEKFVDFLARAYVTGFIFDMGEWHDGFIFKTALKMTLEPDTKLVNLTSRPNERDVFDFSPLTEWYDHLKGPRKSEVDNQSKANVFIPVETAIKYDPEDQ